MSKHPTLEHPVIQMELSLNKLDLEWVKLAAKSIKESHTMAKKETMKPTNYTGHVAAIVKGVIEHDDPIRHFGSTLGYKDHLSTAIEEGLVTLEEAKHREGFTYLKETVTTLGRTVYKQQGWDKLEDTRANYWSTFND